MKPAPYEELIYEAKLPTFSDRWKNPFVVQSSYEEGVTYLVNIFKMECTCPDFEMTRSKHPPNKFERMCKHLAGVIFENADKIGLDMISKLAIFTYSKNKRLGFTKYITITTTMGDAILVHGIGSDWLNIFCTYASPEKSFEDLGGFGISKSKTWALGCEPPNAKEIELTLKEMGFFKKR